MPDWTTDTTSCNVVSNNHNNRETTMRIRDLQQIDNHAAALRYLKGRQRATIANNTTMRVEGDDIVVTYHSTDIVTYHADGGVTLRDGGWSTATTVQRLHAMTPGNVTVRREKIGEYDHATAVAVPGDVERRIIGELTVYPHGEPTYCQHPGRHHSDDLVEVHTGSPFGPRRYCGYHASQS